MTGLTSAGRRIAYLPFYGLDHAESLAVVLPGVAHLVGMERPDALADLVAACLEPLRPWE